MSNPYLTAALAYAKRGWPVVALHSPVKAQDGLTCSCGGNTPRGACSPGKHPRTLHGFKDATVEVATLRSWWGLWPGANVGLRSGEASGVVVLDVDPKHGGSAALDALLAVHGPLPVTPEVVTGGGGRHFYFAYPVGVAVKNSVGKVGVGLDIRGEGGYITAPPSLHVSGRQYGWGEGRSPDDVPLAPLPPWLLKLATAPKGAKAPSDKSVRGKKDGQTTLNVSRAADGKLTASVDAQRYANGALGRALMVVANAKEGTRNETLNAESFAIGTLVGAGALLKSLAAAELLDAAIACGLPEDEARATIQSGLTAGMADPRDLSHLDIGPFMLNEGGNAERLEAWHQGKLRYCDAWGWLAFDGARWKADKAGAVMAATEVIKTIQRQADMLDERSDKASHALAKTLRAHAGRSYRSNSIEGMLRLASSRPAFRIALDALDRDPWLLNVANGTLDLRTGELRPHDPADLLTKVAPVVYDAAATCPLWDRFLLDIMDGDREMVDFLRRAVGYSLTGLTTEQRLFIAHGTGRNGKSVFLSTLLEMLGDYGAETPATTLLIRKHDGGIPNDVARLQRPHLVSANETDDGAAMDEAKVKAMTGGDKITARFLHQEWFEFTPRFTVWLRTNSLPRIKGLDEGIWRRLVPIPFEVTIPEEKVDRDLLEKLRAELPGILAWAVRGANEWRQNGLGVPERIQGAMTEYRTEQDSVAAFLEWCPAIPPRVRALDFHQQYASYMANTRRSAVSQTAFGRRLTDMGWGSLVAEGITYRVPPANQVRDDGLEGWGESLM